MKIIKAFILLLFLAGICHAQQIQSGSTSGSLPIKTKEHSTFLKAQTSIAKIPNKKLQADEMYTGSFTSDPNIKPQASIIKNPVFKKETIASTSKKMEPSRTGSSSSQLKVQNLEKK